MGWGAKFDDESQLSTVMDQLEHSQIKMLDRYTITAAAVITISS